MEHQIISKGIYNHSQIDNFVSVKNYIFIRKDEKKHLLLRFSNDFNYVVNAMTYFVIQRDSSGRVLDHLKITHEKLEFQPNTMYVTEQPICVNEDCSDFKIVFLEVISDFYRYEVHSDMIAVHYIKTPEPIVDVENLNKKEQRKRLDVSVSKYRVKQKKFQERGVAAFVSVLVTVVMLGLNVLNMFAGYIEARNPSVIYGFMPKMEPLIRGMNTLFSSVSKYLDFLTNKVTVIIILLLVALIFAFAVRRCLRARKSTE